MRANQAGAELAASGRYGSEQVMRISTKQDSPQGKGQASPQGLGGVVVTPVRRSRRTNSAAKGGVRVVSSPLAASILLEARSGIKS